MIKLIRITEAP